MEMLLQCSRVPRRLLSFEFALEVDLDLLAWLHRDDEWNGFEAGDEVEDAFFWDGYEAFRDGGVDG